jgi:hypothetical protein
MWVWNAELRVAMGCRGNRPSQVLGANSINIENGECSGSSRRDSERNGSACASGADEQHRFVCRMKAFPRHAENTAKSVENCTDPAAIIVASDDVDGSNFTRGRM